MDIQNRIPNRLATEKSPYLLQHAYNPVDWHPWGEEAFNKAKAEDKPVFLSIGYSSCHWCHVMERESFEDEEVALLLNQNFISIKVDREERPDVDHLYMTACMAMNGQGGWPLSVFITPDRKPFYTGTYFPKVSLFGSIGFMDVLEHIAKAWKTDRDALTNSAEQILQAINEPVQSTQMPNDIYDSVAAMLIRSYDPKYGGFGSAPKFPSPYNLLFLMRWAYGKAPENHAWEVVSGTLDAIAKGGIRDHIGGGFFRYSTDSKWLVPHFEKMLYDQAMLMMAYTEGVLVFGEKYKRPVIDIARFLMHDMTAPMGGFYTAYDADSEGEEGKYYLWTPKEVISVLGEADGKRFCSIFDIGTVHMENGSIPNYIGRELSDEDRRFADQCLPKLEQHRRKRVPPFRDEKVLSANNGLMIAALAKAGRALNEPSYIEAARRAANFIKIQLVLNNKMMASWIDGETAHLATQDAYAYWVWGLLELYEATSEPNWLENAIFWNDQMLKLFGEGTDGLYYTGNDATDLPLRQQNAQDGAVPSGISVAAMNMLVLSRLTGRTGLADRAEKLIQSAGAEAVQYPHGYTALLTAWLYARHPGADVVLTTGEGFQSMLGALNGFYPFMLHVVKGSAYEKIDELAPYTKQMTAQEGKASAYCCVNNACNPPTTESLKLSRMIQ